MSLATRSLSLCQANPTKDQIRCDLYEAKKSDATLWHCGSKQSFTQWNGITSSALQREFFKAYPIFGHIFLKNYGTLLRYHGHIENINIKIPRNTDNDANDRSQSTTKKNHKNFKNNGIKANMLRKSVQGMIVAASDLMGKAMNVVKELKLTASVTVGSMILAVSANAMYFGFPQAIGELGLIFIHEIGHAVVMYQRGIPFYPIIFLPFNGAFVAMKQKPRDAWEEVMVSAGGPVLGSVGAAVVALAARITRYPILYDLANFGYLINLLNLLPIGCADGGRIAGALSKWIQLGCFGLSAFLAYHIHCPLVYLLLLLDFKELFQHFFDKTHLPSNYYVLTVSQSVTIITGHIGLITALLCALKDNLKHQRSP